MHVLACRAGAVCVPCRTVTNPHPPKTPQTTWGGRMGMEDSGGWTNDDGGFVIQLFAIAPPQTHTQPTNQPTNQSITHTHTHTHTKLTNHAHTHTHTHTHREGTPEPYLASADILSISPDSNRTLGVGIWVGVGVRVGVRVPPSFWFKGTKGG